MSSQTPDRYLIIPAAGRGVRFKELGRLYPKCILPVEGVPIIIKSLRALMDTEAFAGAVVTCADESARHAIRETLDRYGFADVRTVVVDWQYQTPSPALSLSYAAGEVLKQFGVNDADLTVVLSDLLPDGPYCVDAIVGMRPDTWGVVENEPGDYERWCMVYRGNDSLVFMDKPKVAPPTRLAACGVYRWSSAQTLMAATRLIIENRDDLGELQFSDVAVVYQGARPIDILLFDSSEFVDFGTLEAYMGNRGLANKARSFNTVALDKETRIVTKTSPDVRKMSGEYHWLVNSTGKKAQYVPRPLSFDWLNDGSGVYTMEYVSAQNLRELALYLDRSYETWVGIFKRVRDFIRSRREDASEPMRWWTTHVWNKSKERSYGKCAEVDSWLTDVLYPVLQQLDVHPSQLHGSMYHGDLHFANMFYCFTYDSLKVIDPNGMRTCELYDVAKLCHSVFGRYDYIDGDLYAIDGNGNTVFYDKGHEEIERAFRDVILNEYSADTRNALQTVTASLFLTMIPLHTDNPVHCKLFWDEFERMKVHPGF